MAEGYLGEFPVDVAVHPVFATRTPTDWAIEFISLYGQIDGEQHKTWVLDQVARILHGTKVAVTEARWSTGLSEYRFHLDEPTPEYREWVEKMLGDTDANGEREYSYNAGI